MEQVVVIIVDQDIIHRQIKQEVVDHVDQENIHQEQQIQDVPLV